jgi:hypothetical protein
MLKKKNGFIYNYSLNFENTVTQKRKFRVICEEHFNENDSIHNPKRKRLKKNSLPMAKVNFLIEEIQLWSIISVFCCQKNKYKSK